MPLLAVHNRFQVGRLYVLRWESCCVRARSGSTCEMPLFAVHTRFLCAVCNLPCLWLKLQQYLLCKLQWQSMALVRCSLPTGPFPCPELGGSIVV